MRPRALVLPVALLALAAACARPSLGGLAVADISTAREVWVATSEELWGEQEPWHVVTDPGAVARFVALLQRAPRVGQARMPYPLGDGSITLVLHPYRLYALRYSLAQRRILDLHTGYWYAFPRGFEEALKEMFALETTRR